MSAKPAKQHLLPKRFGIVRSNRFALALFASLLVLGCSAKDLKESGDQPAKTVATNEPSPEEKLRSSKVQQEQAVELVTQLADKFEALRQASNGVLKEEDLAPIGESLDEAGNSLAELSERGTKGTAKKAETQIDETIDSLHDAIFQLRDFSEGIEELKLNDKLKPMREGINETLDQALDAALGALHAVGGEDEEQPKPKK